MAKMTQAQQDALNTLRAQPGCMFTGSSRNSFEDRTVNTTSVEAVINRPEVFGSQRTPEVNAYDVGDGFIITGWTHDFKKRTFRFHAW